MAAYGVIDQEIGAPADIFPRRSPLRRLGSCAAGPDETVEGMNDERIAFQKRPQRRLALLIDGHFDIFRHKTAMALLRYCPEDVVCVIDDDLAGTDLYGLAGVGQGIPVVATVAEALAYEPAYLVIGVATADGWLPEDIRRQIYQAIRARIGIIGGLHQGLLTDPNIASLACRNAVELIDLAQEVDEDFHAIGTAAARELPVFRCLMVGTDSNLGKMTTAIQLEMHLRWREHRKARFVATGQNGILIKGRGTRIDRVLADFAAGAAEELCTREARGMELLLVEGQGSLLQPAFSGVCLSLLHGICPDAMILCHHVGRTSHRHSTVPIPPLEEYAHVYEHMMRPLHARAKVVGISLNTYGMTADAAAAAIEAASTETGLPVADTVREGADGCARLSAAIAAHAQTCGMALSTYPDWYTNRFDRIRPIGS